MSRKQARRQLMGKSYKRSNTGPRILAAIMAFVLIGILVITLLAPFSSLGS